MALLMFGYFFFVITTFWVLKPIKKGLFIGYYDHRSLALFGLDLGAAQAELIAKMLNVVVAFVAVVAFTWLSRRLHRERLTLVFSAFFAMAFLAYTRLLDRPSAASVWTFYLFGDLYSTVMVATFFAFLNDSVSPNTARRIYGVVVLGGVIGGVVGSTVVSTFIGELRAPSWMWPCLAVTGLIVILALIAGRVVRSADASAGRDEHPRDEPSGDNPALAGALLVSRSRYLLSIAAIVGIYEVVSTLMDFQFTSTVAHYLDGAAIDRHFSRVFLATNVVSMAVQIVATTYVMTRFPLSVALMALPFAAFGSSALYMVYPGLWVGSALNTADNGLAYSMNQSAKEALYTPTSRDEKYKAKAFIDMFIQRVAKTVAVLLSLFITTRALFSDFGSVRWLSLMTIALAVVWLLVARYAGRRFHELSG